MTIQPRFCMGLLLVKKNPVFHFFVHLMSRFYLDYGGVGNVFLAFVQTEPRTIIIIKVYFQKVIYDFSFSRKKNCRKFPTSLSLSCFLIGCG